jgi:hypothetical protein
MGVIHFLAKRRYNLVDYVSYGYGVCLMVDGRFWTAALLFVSASALSMILEALSLATGEA